MRIIAVLLVCFVLQASAITEQEAISIAEKFVSCNGYTSTPADTVSMRFRYELKDHRDFDKTVKRRHDKLEPKASYISFDSSQKDYYIGFKYTAGFRKRIFEEYGEEIGIEQGRTVKIDSQGKAWMVHKDPGFSMFKKLE